jgi:hypothetical protein
VELFDTAGLRELDDARHGVSLAQKRSLRNSTRTQVDGADLHNLGWDDLRHFAGFVQAGSLSAAAKRLGLLLAGLGAYLVIAPEVVRDLLGRRPATSSDWINLRASFGGAVVGLGAFLLWWPAPRPWVRTVLGLLLWGMIGIGIARAIGFVVDGNPDARQLVWIIGEAAIVIVCAALLRRRRGR